MGCEAAPGNLKALRALSQPRASSAATGRGYFKPRRLAILPRFARSSPSSRAALAQLC